MFHKHIEVLDRQMCMGLCKLPVFLRFISN